MSDRPVNRPFIVLQILLCVCAAEEVVVLENCAVRMNTCVTVARDDGPPNKSFMMNLSLVPAILS